MKIFHTRRQSDQLSPFFYSAHAPPLTNPPFLSPGSFFFPHQHISEMANWLCLPPAHSTWSSDYHGVWWLILMLFWQQSLCVRGIILRWLWLGSVLTLEWMNGTNCHSGISSCQHESTKFSFSWPYRQSFASLMKSSQPLPEVVSGFAAKIAMDSFFLNAVLLMFVTQRTQACWFSWHGTVLCRCAASR